jgi:hypothetical protein
MVAIKRLLKLVRGRSAAPPARSSGGDVREVYMEALEQLRAVDPDLAVEAAGDLGARYYARCEVGEQPNPGP